jgi:4-hydroxy-3-polyprenylbenzoate decarboxylase
MGRLKIRTESPIHLDTMLALARMGVDLCPTMRAFYNHPATIDDIVDYIVLRVLDQLGQTSTIPSSTR